MDLNVLLFLLHCDMISAGCELMRRSRFSSLESETDNPSAGVVITTQPEAPSGSIRLHEDPRGSTWQQPTPLWRRRSCWRSEAWQQADKGVLFLCVLHLSRALYILRTPRGESGLARFHTDETGRRLAAAFHLTACFAFSKASRRLPMCVNELCGKWMFCSSHTVLILWFDGQNNSCSPLMTGQNLSTGTEHWAGTRLQETGRNVEGSSSRGKGRVCQGGLSLQGE